ncbi:hypothetical protein MCOR02_011767 [Pyricularia oryzae]|nr:hypothetical protein MCOR02_011767 [Pyricularia oryzae]KAI6485315.1 hypothetical protein MCOR13_009731 [Pyricularia oryzae]KAI6580371.1 hypothetical protein MCOR04_005731 [Pyricularia oryzae]KAI6630334.1 hypothetical protein MCOR14_008150 [Pyricularia oryzae]
MAQPLADAVLVADPEPVAHARRRFSGTSQHNKAPFGAAGANAADPASTLDPDTCRICRGEATADEPLFYPCKCSGSIKYVHQDCLMEWLSHSQKKHCELCKTPFRFTKLYDRKMPKKLPFVVFITHIVKYMVNNVLVWLRAGLVVSIWLIWLPYLMRSIWSLMFWISDEGFGSNHSRDITPSVALSDRVCPASSILSVGMCPASPLTASMMPEGGGDYSMASVGAANLTTVNPVYSAFFHLVFMTVGLSEKMIISTLADLSSVDTTKSGISHGPQSLLSNVRWLANLTSRPFINKNVIHVLEGQVITVLVILSFILIILVRDYVVLQQPEINMRAAFAAAENQQPPVGVPQAAPPPAPVFVGRHLENPVAGLRAEDIDQLAGPEADEINDAQAEPWTGAPFDFGDTGELPAVEAFGSPSNQLPGGPVRPSTPLLQRLDPSLSDGDADVASSVVAAFGSEGSRTPLTSQERADLALGGATASDSESYVVEPLSVKEYTKVFHEAQGDVERMREIFRGQGLEERAESWLRLGQIRLSDQRAVPGPSSNDANSEKQAETAENAENVGAASPVDSLMSDWTMPNTSQEGGSTSAEKGKQKAVDEATPPPAKLSTPVESNSGSSMGIDRTWDDDPFTNSHPMRPRANTDGQYRSEGVNPLANNSWVFPQTLPDPPQASEEPRLATEDLIAGPAAADDTSTPNIQAQEPPRWEPENRQVDHVAQGREWNDLQDFNEIPATRAAEPAPPPPPAGIVGSIANFMWHGVDAMDLAEQPDLRHVHDGNGHVHPPDLDQPQGDDSDLDLDDDEDSDSEDEDDEDVGDAVGQNPLFAMAQQQADAAADAAAIDPEAIDDAEDFEGVMELLGMRGPIGGLFQNAVFCAFLVSVSVFVGIFLPYNLGRICVWILANPMRPLNILLSTVKFVQDFAMAVAGLLSWAGLRIAYMILSGLEVLIPAMRRMGLSREYVMPVVRTTYYLARDSARRVSSSFAVDTSLITTSEIRNFSAISHEALISLKTNMAWSAMSIVNVAIFVFGGNYTTKAATTVSFVGNMTGATVEILKGVPAVLTNPSSWVININPAGPSQPVSPALAHWSGTDRFWATLVGYLVVCLVAAIYLHHGRPLSSSQAGQEREASLIDALNQGSGVMKVILIIGIEMLIFPLYCGLLLDVALLPLFENTTLKSRLLFTYNFPLTSLFVHWFVGTGYMFHFALFVSMCRKIMRKGVLYFIRDPDDAEFHPVRDVLERNVATQLRKILFSAFVYGALVIVCLGGVVWGLWAFLPNVLPIHYSSNEPVLEFPIDLLFYNFLMPLALNFFKPSDGLHEMYTWWFRKCARALRITWFLFGERKIDEEGILVLAPDSEHRRLPFWRRLFLEVDETGQVVPRTWKGLFDEGKSKPGPEITKEEMRAFNKQRAALIESKQLIADGRFVLTPASDQVKIPKGKQVFWEVSENEVGTETPSDEAATGPPDLYTSKQYQLVYVPPHFRARVFLFILSIWVFAAVTGVSFTIIPLIFGRHVFKMLIPTYIRTNDIYAFSIGVYILGTLAYGILHYESICSKVKKRARALAAAAAESSVTKKAMGLIAHGLRLIYTYTIVLIVFPLLVASLMELYCLIPLDTYMYLAVYSGAVAGDPSANKALQDAVTVNSSDDRHTVRVVQAWTIGLLYLKLGARIIRVWRPDSRPALAVRAVFRRGWLHPNVGVLTRAFLIPGLLFSGVAIMGPPAAANAFMAYTGVGVEDARMAIVVNRLSFPTAALMALMGSVAWATMDVFMSWRVRIRDEAYLIGERLHNFGSGAPQHNHHSATQSGSVGAGAGRVAWREGR